MKRIFLLMILTITLLTLTACSLFTGSIVITENIDGRGCVFQYQEWSGQNKCELSLEAFDELQVKTFCEQGDINLAIHTKTGKEIYTGNHLQTGFFSVKVPEKGEYVLTTKGDHASGNIAISNSTTP